MSALPPPPVPSGSPGPAPYALGIPTGRRPQPLQGLALAASIVLGVTAVVCLLGVAGFLGRASEIDDFLNGDGFGLGQLAAIDRADDRVAAVTLLYVLGTVASAAVFIPWQFRHARNAEALGGRHGLGAEWAIAGWFIPCANWVLPGIQLFQSSRASDPRTAPAAGRGDPLVVVWAVVYGIGTALFGVSQVLFPEDDELIRGRAAVEDAITSDRLAAVAFFVLAAAAVLAAVLVQGLSRRQAARIAVTPGLAGPGAGHPGSAYPGSGYPGSGSPGSAYPGPPGAGTAGPGAGHPGSAYPGSGYPGSGSPGSAYPGPPGAGTAGPGAGHPGSAYPGSGYPGSGSPGSASPGSAYPGPPGAGTAGLGSGHPGPPGAGTAGLGSGHPDVPPPGPPGAAEASPPALPPSDGPDRGWPTAPGAG